MSNLKIEILERYVPDIIIPWQVMVDINNIVSQTEIEIGWIGEAYRNDQGDFVLGKISVPKQKCSGSTTEMQPLDIYDVVGIKCEIENERFRYWGHSHGKIHPLFPSGQDDKQMKEFAENCDWFVGTIHNRQGAIFGYCVDRVKALYYKDMNVVIEKHPEVEKIQMEIFRLQTLMNQREEELSIPSNDWSSIFKERVSRIQQIHNTNAYNGWNPQSWNKNYKQHQLPGSTRGVSQIYPPVHNESVESLPLKNLPQTILTEREWKQLKGFYDKKIKTLEKDF